MIINHFNFFNLS